MSEPLFNTTDDPNLPCPYCVGWRDDPTDDQRAWPVDTKGNRIPSLYSGIHPRCQKMVDDYMAEVRNDDY